jgi:hypothetical protein
VLGGDQEGVEEWVDMLGVGESGLEQRLSARLDRPMGSNEK